MILKIKKILDILSEKDFSIMADSVDFNDGQCRVYMRVNFGNQAFLYDDDGNETETDVANEFWLCWRTYLDMFESNLDKAMAALNAEYNPIENYNRHEEETLTGEREDDTNTNTYNDTVTTHYGQYEEDTSVATYDTTYKDERSVKRGHTPQNNDTEAHTGTVTNKQQYGDTTDTKTSDIHGNIGVMSNQTMIIEEQKLRQFNLFGETVRRFVREYCFTYWGYDHDCNVL